MLIKRTAKAKNYPKVLGSKEDRNQFLIMLIRTQKALHDWCRFLIDIVDQVQKSNMINTKVLNKKYPSKNVKKDIWRSGI